MSENNAFIKLQESANGRVSVKLQKNQFAKDGSESFFGKVERYTFTVPNILNEMEKELPLLNLGTIASVLTVYINVILKALSLGYAVKFGELGTFYIAGKGIVENGEKPNLTVKFTATQLLKDVVQNIEIASSEYVQPVGLITSIIDVTTGNSDGTLKEGTSVLIEGTGLKIGGDASGIYFAPLTETNDISSESTWTKVEGALVFNTSSKLLFSIPQSVIKGKYKIVLRSHIVGRNTYERKNLIETISDVITIS